MHDRESEEVPAPRRHISRRTAQLPLVSKVLYRIDHYSSMPAVAITGVLLLVVFLVVGGVIGFPSQWVVAFEVTVAALTLMMVFTIQHTQSREQAATQRKLDELLRAVPGAAASLMMLEEAPKETLLEVEDVQRETRHESVEAEAETESSAEPDGTGPGE
ncbi:MAG TPA: low affinity iron permease family protein [Acidimicrobiales bacterium]